MSIVNLNNLLYNLINTRTYLINSFNENEEELLLLANNNIAFSLTESEFSKFNKTIKKNRAASALVGYTLLHLKDEQLQHTYKNYPILAELKVQNSNFLQGIFDVLASKISSNLTGIVLSRSKTGFNIRLFGVMGFVSSFEIVNQLPALWKLVNAQTKNSILFSYSYIFKKIIMGLNTFTLIQIKSLCINILFQYRQQQYLNKRNKKTYSKWFYKIKMPIHFTNEKERIYQARKILFTQLDKQLKLDQNFVKQSFTNYRKIL